jgi:CRISPR/Cas system-associated endonuclease/helicase Cas3
VNLVAVETGKIGFLELIAEMSESNFVFDESSFVLPESSFVLEAVIAVSSGA